MLADKVVFLTGGADGIGWECALAYAKAGATVCIADINPGGENRINLLQGEKHLFIKCDVSFEDDVKLAIETVIKTFGRLDIVHNNAGIVNPSKPLHTTTNQEWESLMNINLKSILFTTRYALDHLAASEGNILNTSSLVGSIGQDNHAAYVATKGAVNALTKAMALDYAKLKVRVNAVAPAAIKTPALDAWSQQQPNVSEIKNYLNKLQPLGAMPAGDVIADACVFLVSDAARFITGCILTVSGGAELGYKILV
ncbi:SDR family oxidoreductase [Danxiaibacter flavus]|uniref:SDR family oxidoreductase n=1 Tax=Danxiaibacter flavus TaxID=3049108 RepID=A0ABV3ZM34_9BACT|nr:SDR family oxidoreductase [Chitinophagaceae bacterium DXS]